MNWKGISFSLKIGVARSVSLPADSSTLTSKTQTYSISLKSDFSSKIAFNADDTGLSTNLIINTTCKVANYTGNVATITQADVNEFVYENLLPLEQMVY